MKQLKPFFFTTLDNFPYKAYLEYDWRNRTTDYLIFIKGRQLPFEDIGRTRYSQDPATYDLIFESQVSEEYLQKFDVLPCTVDLLLVSKRCVKLLLELCPDDFQFFPIIIHNKNDKIEAFENRDYVLLNITVTVDAVDHEKSSLVFSKYGLLENPENLVLKEDGLNGHHIARLEQSRSIEIVSPTLVKLFKKEKIKGIKFRENY